MFEPTVSSLSMQTVLMLCERALYISWAKKLTPCFQGRSRSDPKAQAGIGTATVFVPPQLNCTSTICKEMLHSDLQATSR